MYGVVNLLYAFVSVLSQRQDVLHGSNVSYIHIKK